MSIPPINLTPAELQAIEEHKYFLSQQRGVEVSIEDAIQDFLDRFATDWRLSKLRRDNLDQRSEIEKHKYFRSLQEGRDIGRAVAAAEWCEQFARVWRAERESLQRNGFQLLTVVVQNPHELHLRPWSRVAALASKHDCELYVHKTGMPYWNFLLEGRPYMNVKSVVGFLSMGLAVGDTLDFLATGAHAAAALADLNALLLKTTEVED